MPERPNIVFICSDQHGYRYTGYNEHPHVETPQIDRIADEGVVFDDTYCSSPVCTPSRASLATGVHPSDVNSFCNSTVWDGSNPTWGSLLRDAGYRTWATGKLDLNPSCDIGFEEVDTTHGHAENPDITSLFRRPLCYRVDERPMVDGESREERSTDEALVENATTFLQQEAPNEDRPWAMWVGFNQPHPPFSAHEDHYYPGRVDLPDVPPGHFEDQHLVFQRLRHFKRVATPIPDGRVRRARAAYYGMIAELDEYVGRIRTALAESGELEDTIFIYTSDHGEMLGEHGLWYKNCLYEDAARVPLVVSGPGIPAGITVEAPVGHVDLVHTILDWADAERPDPERGHSLRRLIEGQSEDHPGYAYCENHTEGNCTGSFMVRRGDWKYVHFTWYDDILFNLAEDPHELENRIDDPDTIEVREEMIEILRSRIDPEAMTRRAFRTQENQLQELYDSKGLRGFFEELQGRLGPGQARALVDKHTP